MKLVAAAAAIAVSMMLMTSAARAGSAEGTWVSDDGGLKVRLSDCGGKLCGKVVWLNEPIDQSTGRPKTDKRNPDPAKRARPLVGLKVVNGLKPSGPNSWSGSIYNADDGNIYQAHLKVEDEHTARLQGCVLGVLCKTRTWQRVN
jgi:uncharacterized protein (DUF2147 family)